MKETEAEKLLHDFISSWLSKDVTLFLQTISDNIVYSECYGPIYANKAECEQWFTEWNKERRVTKWDITDFAFDELNTKISFEWFFECDQSGDIYSFNGCSFMKILDNQFISINEYKTESDHYYPYNNDKPKIITKTYSPLRFDYVTEYKWPETAALSLLLNQTSWANNRTSDEISLLYNNSDIVVSIYDNNTLIGFGRIITDGKYRGLLDDIIVDVRDSSLGIGSKVVDLLLVSAGDIEEVFLNTGKEHQKFYENCGFTPFNGLTMVKRSNAKKIGLTTAST